MIVHRTIPPQLLILAIIFSVPGQAQFVQQGSKLVGTGALGTVVYQGQSVAISADGNTAIVGGNNDGPLTPTGWAGAAWIYIRSGATWVQQGSKLVGTGAIGGAQQGQSVAISGDGNTAIVGGPFDGFTGAAWVYTRSGGTWVQQGSKLVGTGAPVDAFQGVSVALSYDGNTALVGGNTDSGGIGAVWVFTRSSGTWVQQGQKLVGSGFFGLPNQGIAVALSADGNTALVGGNLDNNSAGAAWVFTRSNGVWNQQGPKLSGIGATGGIVYQGNAVALSADGNTAILGAPFDNSGVGASFVFTRGGAGIWTQQGSKLVGSNGFSPEQGHSVALSGDGATALVGGPLDVTGAVWVYRRASNGLWVQQGNKIVPTGEVGSGNFGWSAALSQDGGTAVVGGWTDNGGMGAAWVLGQPHFTITAPASVTGGGSFQLAVSAVDANNAPLTSYNGVLHFTSTDPAAALPPDATLSAGTRNFSATLNSTGSQTITAADTVNSALRGISSAIVVNGGQGSPLGPVGVNPSGGSATSMAMTFTFNDPRGYQDLGVVNVLINNSLDGRHACYLAYSRPLNVLYLVSDDGSTLLGGAMLSAANSVGNGQCTVSWGSAPVNGNGNTLGLTLTVTFTSAFAGNKVVYLAARDVVQNNSGWQPLGVWQVPGGAQTTTNAVVGMTPNRGSGSGPTTYILFFSDTRGFADLGVQNILVNDSLDGRHACYLAYSRPLNVLYLVNDNGDGLLGGAAMNAPGSVSNSQCTVSWAATAVTANGTNLALTLNLTFSAAFKGNRIFFLASRDVSDTNNSGWQAMGTWTVQ